MKEVIKNELLNCKRLPFYIRKVKIEDNIPIIEKRCIKSVTYQTNKYYLKNHYKPIFIHDSI